MASTACSARRAGLCLPDSAAAGRGNQVHSGGSRFLAGLPETRPAIGESACVPTVDMPRRRCRAVARPVDSHGRGPGRMAGRHDRRARVVCGRAIARSQAESRSAETLPLSPPDEAIWSSPNGGSTQASPHVGKRVVLKIDLQDFFPSISVARIQALFRTVGYPEGVADLLAGLCTNSTPLDVWEENRIQTAACQMRQARWLYSQPHLPQGAPTSPALANLCAYRLDCRLRGLAQSAGAVYTRYADDLAFSGDRDFERVAKRFHLHACATVMEEGFSVHHRKTRIMRHGVCQRLTGMVVNECLNVPRDDFDRLKATLTNCIRFGPESQNRRGHNDYRRHLDGRISYIEMVNPARGRRLRKLFNQLEW